MTTNFHELKRQLTELSETINKFESEAVQLRIVELLFNQASDSGRPSEAARGSYTTGPSRAGRHRESGKQATPVVGLPGRASRARATAPSASGAVAALSGLVSSDFFSQKRSIRDIVKKCEEDLGTRYKSNAFSGPLSRYAGSGVLKREKNAEGKYVYFK